MINQIINNIYSAYSSLTGAVSGLFNEKTNGLEQSNPLLDDLRKGVSSLKGEPARIFPTPALAKLHLMIEKGEIKIPSGKKNSDFENLFGELQIYRNDLEPLLKLGLLKKDQLNGLELNGLELTATHKQHLRSDGVILLLASGKQINLYAFYQIPEEYVKKGIIETILEMLEMLEEGSDKNRTILKNMKESGLFVNIYSELPFRTPLHKAVSTEDRDMIKILLEYGAADSLNSTDSNDKTPLNIAENRKGSEIYDFLCQG